MCGIAGLTGADAVRHEHTVGAMAKTMAVFQRGWLGSLFGVEETGPIVAMIPISMVGVIFGLAMDYEVFVVTRTREAYVHGEDPRQAIVTGSQLGARVVTAVAFIMIAVCSGFISSGEQMIKLMGFCLAIAVYFDAFVIRMAVVPVVLALLGNKAGWLPSGWTGSCPTSTSRASACTRCWRTGPKTPTRTADWSTSETSRDARACRPVAGTVPARFV